MKVDIPIEYDDILIEIVTQNVIQEIQKSKKLDSEVDELPPYPNRKQVKWIDRGLKVIPFCKEIRFDREDIQKFLNNLKL